jgi:phosphatidate cytidylyltransferase
LILLSAWKGSWFFLAVVLLIVSPGTYEFYRLSSQKNVRPQQEFGIILANTLCFLAFGNAMEQIWLVLAMAAVLMLIYELFRNAGNALLNISVTLAGALYVGLLLGFLLIIRQLPVYYGKQDAVGGHLIILIFITIWFCDSAAYILGSKIGSHKLFPRVSPNKTVEGTAAGFIVAILTAGVYGYMFIPELLLVDLIMLGAICGSAGQLSDLVESLLKRDAGVKDSSNLIPGHGGILDRFDSEILVLPLAYGYLNYVVF